MPTNQVRRAAVFVPTIETATRVLTPLDALIREQGYRTTYNEVHRGNIPTPVPPPPRPRIDPQETVEPQEIRFEAVNRVVDLDYHEEQHFDTSNEFGIPQEIYNQILQLGHENGYKQALKELT